MGHRTGRRPPRRLSEEQLEQYALRALARRAHSTRELRQKLEPRALTPPHVDRLLQHLTERGWLDDRRFALAYVRFRAQNRRYGRYRLTRELRRKGVAEEWIGVALAEVFPTEKDERVLVRQRIERRLRHQRPPYSVRLLQSLYASLLRAGFSSAIIRSELFRRRRGDIPEEELELPQDEEA